MNVFGESGRNCARHMLVVVPEIDEGVWLHVLRGNIVDLVCAIWAHEGLKAMDA